MKDLNLDEILELIKDKKEINLLKFKKHRLESRIIQFIENKKIERFSDLLVLLKKDEEALDSLMQYIFVGSTNFNKTSPLEMVYIKVTLFMYILLI